MAFGLSTLNPASIGLLEGVLRQVSSTDNIGLFANTLSLLNPRQQGLEYEHELLVRALSTQDAADVRTARSLYQKPSRLFYALTPHVERLRRALGVEEAAPRVAEISVPDTSAYLAWARLGAGAGMLIDAPALFDPIGDLSSVMAFLDHRGLRAHWEKRRQHDAHWMPPPALAFLARNETPEKLERYNRGDLDRVGHTAFDFPPELQTVIPPAAYRNLVRAKAGLQYVIPASHVLGDHFNEDWARRLPADAVVATGIKGLCDGKTPREHIDELFGRVGRADSMVGIYGFMPATRWLQEQRGERSKSGVWEVLLTDPAMVNGLAMARRMAGPEASEKTETSRGVSYLVVENMNFDPPLRFHIVSDPDVIRTNEIASVYKNLQALHLGRFLFDRMVEAVRKGEPWSPNLNRRFAKQYADAMKRAKRDIVVALDLENIPPNKRVLLPFVENDMEGSWSTSQFEEIYKLIAMIFDPAADEAEWGRGMILLKIFIRNYFSVRNPCYGLCVAANVAVSEANRWLSKKKVEDLARGLMAEGRLVDGKGRPLSWEKIRELLELDQGETHYGFSMIPAGLLPEALQIAEQLPMRLKRNANKMDAMPESFQSAYLSVQRMRHRFLFDPRIYREIVDLTRVFATVFVGSPDADQNRYVGHMKRLLGLLNQALKEAEVNERALGEKRDTTIMLYQLLRRLGPAIQRLQRAANATPERIAWFNQAVIEMLTAANRFAVVAMSDRQTEGQHLVARAERLRNFVVPRGASGNVSVRMGEIDELYSRNGTVSTLTETEKEALIAARENLFQVIGEGLIGLTHHMNLKLHQEKTAVEKKDIVRSFELLATALHMAADALGEQKGVVAGIQDRFQSILARLPGTRFSAEDKYRVYQSVIEVLIHVRRFLVLPAEWAVLEVEYTVNRLNQIDLFLAGDEASPLWHYRKAGGSGTPPKGTPTPLRG